MTIKDARIKLGRDLKEVYDSGEAKNITELVLENIAGLSKMEQSKNTETVLSSDQIEKQERITEQLKRNVPVQYVLDEAWFAGMKFKVNKNVLIPRPETEELTEWIVREAGRRNSGASSILDVGTGSGCIPISIKKKLPAAAVSALDVCSEAIFTAAENAIAHETDIEFILLDFLDENKWKELGQYDIIVSNPPYVRQSEKEKMHQRVAEFEPHLALFVPDSDPLLFYRKLADFSKSHLKPGGSLFVEINEELGKEVMELFRSTGFNQTELKKDMQGKERMMKAAMNKEL